MGIKPKLSMILVEVYWCMRSCFFKDASKRTRCSFPGILFHSCYYLMVSLYPMRKKLLSNAVCAVFLHPNPRYAKIQSTRKKDKNITRPS